jgi:subtilase family serine protease
VSDRNPAPARTGRRVASAGLAGILLLLAILAAHTALPAGSPAATARVLGPAAPNRVIGVSLILRLPHERSLERFLGASSRPGSPSYRQTLSPSAFGVRFGLPGYRIRTLREALAAHGLTVTGGYPQRTALRATGTVTALGRAFATRLQERVDARGRHYIAPSISPTVPRWLGADVIGVTGLDTRPVLVAADVPAGGLSPQTLSTAYDFASLRGQGIDGSGQTVAVVSFDSFAGSDLSDYQSRFAIKGPQVQRVPIDGGTQPGSGQPEVDLDVDTIRAIAPGAQVLDYEAPQGIATEADVINQIVADHRARVISTSWGRCDLLLSPDARTAEDQALAAARASGITIFAASGDNGAYDCQSADLGDQRVSVDWPAASANVVAVGGTRLAVRADGSYLAEYGWEDVLQGGGSGGGVASVTPRPSWQQGPGVLNANSNGHRQIPDVAGPADPASGMMVFATGRLREIGGTSAAAPFWAASLLLMREYAQRHGVRDLGFIAPLLYRIAANRATAHAFHEPVRGGNRRFVVTPGWNYVSGLGTPDVALLARDLVQASHQS